VVAQAVTSLRGRQEPEAAEFIAGKLQSEDDENLIVLMLNSLRAMHSPLGEATADMHFKASLSENLTATALGYLAEVRADRIVAVVDSLRSVNPPPRVRAACAEAYGEVGNSSVIPRLAMLFTDEDPMVRASAFQQLIHLDSTNIDLYLKDALNDPDMMPVILALDEIGRREKVEYLPQVQDMVQQGAMLDVDIRRSLIDVVDQFIKVLGADSAMAELLVKGLFDPNYIVRRSAAEVYQQAYDRDRFNMVAPAETRISERRIRNALGDYTGNPKAVIVTEKGDIELELLFDIAPLTVLTFIELASDDFYKGLIFHRVVPNFVIQGGDPRGDGWGGPDYSIRDEFSRHPFLQGTVGIATSGHDTGGSQFFITHSPQPHLDARYTVFGQVTGGQDVVDRISVGDVIEDVIIKDN
jgi:cyclophilin family peptidyl-prolyl cis-trans isomerase